MKYYFLALGLLAAIACTKRKTFVGANHRLPDPTVSPSAQKLQSADNLPVEKSADASVKAPDAHIDEAQPDSRLAPAAPKFSIESRAQLSRNGKKVIFADDIGSTFSPPQPPDISARKHSATTTVGSHEFILAPDTPLPDAMPPPVTRP